MAVWSELTGGYPLQAPASSATRRHARHMYRAFLRHELSVLRAPLLELGRELLHQVGDAQPDRVELRLGLRRA